MGFRSLKARMLYSLIFAVALAAALFVSVRALGNAYINRIYLSSEEKEQRELAYVSELQGFVDKNALTSNDSQALAEWARDYKYLYVMIHKDELLLFESPDYVEDGKDEEPPAEDDPEEKPDDPKGEPNSPEDEPQTPPEKDDGKNNSPGSGDNGIIKDRPTREELIKYAEERGSHILMMGDGSVLVSMAEFTEYLYYNLVNAVAVAAAVMMLVIVIMLYFNGLTGRISRLAAEVNEVALTDINKPIPVKGKDEIGNLSLNVENMRSSILKSLEHEREAMNANNQLITAMSHDVRTPLTVLLGYIDIMKSTSQDEVMQEYLRASETTALRLKELSDDLFNYFLIFGRGAEGVENEECDGAMLLEQLFSEYGVVLREKGYTLNISDGLPTNSEPLTVKTDTGKLTRIFGNLFSNILKYADPTVPVLLKARVENRCIRITISNGISSQTALVESNGIGLKTCAKLSELLKIDFSTEKTEQSYTVKIGIPLMEN